MTESWQLNAIYAGRPERIAGIQATLSDEEKKLMERYEGKKKKINSEGLVDLELREQF